MSRSHVPIAFAIAFCALLSAPRIALATTGPVAAYGFSETSGSTATDSSGFGNAGLVDGATRVSGGKYGAALSFDGTNDRVRIPDSTSLDLTTGMTLEAWVNPRIVAGWHSVILKERTNDLTYALYGAGANAPGAQLTGASAGDYKMANSITPLPTNVWSHLAATYDGNQLKLYVNGALVTSTVYNGSIVVSNGDLYIGGNNVWGEWFDGLIDEVRIYDRALAPTELQTDMNTPVGDDGSTPTPTPTVTFTPTPTPTPTPPPDAATKGSWTPPVDWPLVAVHASMLSNGKVAMWDAFGAALGSERIWDPATGLFQSTPSGLNLFCAGHVLLPDGRLFVAGGHVLAYVGTQNTALLNPLTGTWTEGPLMSRGRWYPTATTLPDGRVLIVSGDGIPDTNGPYNAFYKPSNTIPEIYDPATNTLTQLPSAARQMPLYPFEFVLPDGRVVDAGPDTTTRFLNVQTGTWSTLASQSPIDGHSAVMYRPGKILKSGTWTDPDFPTSVPITNRAAAIDFTETVPTWREVSPMHYKRTFQTLTVLPTGDVLALAGQSKANGNSVTTSADLTPEIWNPATDTWTDMNASQRPRGYHNTSMLLPDGRILLAGSGRLDGSLMPNEQTSEIFSPPYLFKGPRPTITSSPDRLQYGTSFTVDSPDAASVAKVALIRTGAVTHGLNMDQRYQELNFTRSGNTLTIDGPANANVAPPGVYYVFLISNQGVPSVAPLIPLANTTDATPPTAPTGLTATGAIGKVTLNWTAATDNVGVAKYEVHRSATGGFTPSAATKIATVTGTGYVDDNRPAGTYYYRVIALDAVGNASAPSAQATGVSQADTTPPTVTAGAPATGSGTITLTATASDNVGVTGVQFKVDGNNLGSVDTTAPYSANWDTTGASAGNHQVTAVASDAAGNSTTSAPVTVNVDNTAPPAPTPVAAYGFEETTGSSVTDATGKGHTGTLTNATRTTTGKNGRALSFNGTSASVSIPDANDLDLTTGMTLEAWVNPTNNSGWRTALIKERSGDLSYALYAGGSTTPLATITTTGASGYGEAPGPAGSAPATNTWTHLAATYDGTSLKLYKNGALIASSTRAGSIAVGTGPLKLGGNAIWGEWFAGQMDDVRVYDKALTTAQIQTDMNTAVGSTPPPPDTTAPSVPTGLTAIGAIGKVTLNWTASTDNVGVTGYGVYRDGTRIATATGTNYVDTNRPAGTYGYTVRAEDAAGNASAQTAPVNGTSLADTTPPTVTASAPATASGTVTVTATAADDVGVVGVQFKLDGANLGAEDTTAPYAVSWDTTTAAAGAHAITAVARDAANNATTSAPVTSTVDNSAPPAPTPVAAYNFEETSGTTITDITGRGHTGTISNAARTTTGKNGRALSFNGTNASVSIPDANDLDLGTGMTLEAWVNPTNNSGWRTAIIKELTGDLAYALYAGGSTTPLTTITTVGASGYGEAPGPAGSAPPTNTWTHLAGTYDGTTLKLYRNGSLISTTTYPGTIKVGTGPLKLGGNAIWGEWFAGQLDDVRVYNSALTAAQIQTDMSTAVH